MLLSSILILNESWSVLFTVYKIIGGGDALAVCVTCRSKLSHRERLSRVCSSPTRQTSQNGESLAPKWVEMWPRDLAFSTLRDQR